MKGEQRSMLMWTEASRFRQRQSFVRVLAALACAFLLQFGCSNDVPARGSRDAAMDVPEDDADVTDDGFDAGSDDDAAAQADADPISLDLTSIAITPANAVIAPGTALQLTATGIYADSSTLDLTADVSWSSSDVSKLSFDVVAPGNAAAHLSGEVMVTVQLGAVSASTLLTVSSASLVALQVTPFASTIASGTMLQLAATGTFSDGSTQDLTTSVSWSSANPSFATVSSAGVMTGVAPGDATISAMFGSTNASASVNVSAAALTTLAIVPGQVSLAKGTSMQLSAIGTFSDQTTQDLTAQVSWSSTTPAVATVGTGASSPGLLSALSAGETTISISSGAISATRTVAVTTATLTSITLTPQNPALAKGTSQAFVAVGLFSDDTTQDVTGSVAWTSSNQSVASIGNSGAQDGVAVALSPGQSTITAALGSVSGTTMLTVTPATLTSISVTPADASIAKSSSQQFTAKGTFSDGSVQDLTSLVSWSSSAAGIASISNAFGSRGVALGVAAGVTTISAARNGITGSAQLHVTDATLTAITLSPLASTVAKGSNLQFKAVGTYSDNTAQDITSAVTWSSSATNVAMIGNNLGSKGVAVALNAGNTTIQASLGAVSASTTLTVTGATLVSIEVTPASATLAPTQTQQYKATGRYSDNSTQDLTNQVTWLSSKPKVATIGNVAATRGLATAVAAGETIIRALSLMGISGETILKVQ
jgi:hypothetical protein